MSEEFPVDDTLEQIKAGMGSKEGYTEQLALIADNLADAVSAYVADVVGVLKQNNNELQLRVVELEKAVAVLQNADLTQRDTPAVWNVS